MQTLDMEALLEPVEYRYEESPETTYLFIVVGAGGTGGYLIPNLARMVSVRNDLRNLEGKNPHEIVIIDADEVEPKNLRRQQFVSPDIGKNKAQVMASRYGKGFGLTIGYRDDILEHPNQLDSLLNNRSRMVPVFVDCVDNNKTRLLMKEIYDKQPKAVFLSSGNKEKTGQVIFSFKNDAGKSSPTFWDIFPDATLDKLPTELSCAEAAESAPQNIHANLTGANLLFGYVNKLLNDQPIDQLVVFFDTVTQLTTVYRGTYHDVSRVLQFVDNNASIARFIPENYREEKQIPTPEENAVHAPKWEEVASGVSVHG